MTIRPVAYFEKLPDEEFTQRVDFVNVLSVGETISGVDVAVFDRADGSSQTAAIISGTPVVSGSTTVDYDLQGGVEGTRYLIAVLATLNTGEKREQWVEMRVPTKVLN